MPEPVGDISVVLLPDPPRAILSADWSKDPRKRSVHSVDVASRQIVELERADWDLGSLLGEARRHAGTGPVLVAMDLALGVPAGFWKAVGREPVWGQPATFLDWLAKAGAKGGLGETVLEPSQWRTDRPFFRVPSGEGGRTQFESLVEGGMRREIDRRTRANLLFAVSGIPGTVGSGTRSLWTELAPLLVGERDFAVWPFEVADRPITVAESYPGLAYAAAVAPRLPAGRLRVSKTQQDSREAFCDLLAAAAWVREHGVDLGNLDRARGDEDVFDSLVTAAAMLRCVLERRPLCDEGWIDPVAEGTMLLAGPVDPSLAAQTFTVDGHRERPVRLVKTRTEKPPKSTKAARSATPTYSCPIAGCTKVFRGSRGGWDAHAASPAQHPTWHPEVRDPKERKRLFRAEFPTWF